MRLLAIGKVLISASRVKVFVIKYILISFFNADGMNC